MVATAATAGRGIAVRGVAAAFGETALTAWARLAAA